jgi:hypothetical protein
MREWFQRKLRTTWKQKFLETVCFFVRHRRYYRAHYVSCLRCHKILTEVE